VGRAPHTTYFRPHDPKGHRVDETVLGLDECEALRLADLDGLYQEEAATCMKISRQTFGNIIAQARRKVADALVNGKAIRIAGGTCKMEPERQFACCTEHSCA
jgi:predicted DNA-binding protein (UPF0251 family)